MLELQRKHGNLCNQQIGTDEGAYDDDPLHPIERDVVLLQTYNERTPEEGVGRCRQSDESSSLTLVEVELGQTEDTWSRRAVIPSKKSKTAPMIMKSNAVVKSPWKAKYVAMQPEMRLQQVIVFGICFFNIKKLNIKD